MVITEREITLNRRNRPRSKETGHVNELGIVIDSLNIGVDKLAPFIERVHDATSDAGVLDHHIYVSMHSGLDPKSSDTKQKLERKFPGLVTGLVVNTGTFAHAYTSGLEHAAESNNKVIEMDSGGGHLPEDIGRFIEGLDKKDVVLGSRFISGGKNSYPLQRRMVSKGVTILSNVMWGTEYYDAASGYQGFQSDVLRKLFKVMPPEQWVSVIKGPMHMYQTEARLYIDLMRKSLGIKVEEVPIQYGVEKKGAKLGVPYLLASLSCFFEIGSNKQEILNKFQNLPRK